MKQILPIEDYADALFEEPIESLNLSVGIEHILKAEGLRQLIRLVLMTEREILELPNVGKKTLSDIKHALASKDLKLGMQVEGGLTKDFWERLEVLRDIRKDEGLNALERIRRAALAMLAPELPEAPLRMLAKDSSLASALKEWVYGAQVLAELGLKRPDLIRVLQGRDDNTLKALRILGLDQLKDGPKG